MSDPSDEPQADIYMYCVRLRARPGDANDDVDWAGAYANCYIAYPDSRGAEALARWHLSQNDIVPECVLSMQVIDPDNCDDDIACYVEEAEDDGYSIVLHCWPEDADDADIDEYEDEINPPDAFDRYMARIAGTYRSLESGDRVLRLHVDRHFGWDRNAVIPDGTWHVREDELTLAYFPTSGNGKAVFDGPWRVLGDNLVGLNETLRRVVP